MSETTECVRCVHCAGEFEPKNGMRYTCPSCKDAGHGQVDGVCRPCQNAFHAGLPPPKPARFDIKIKRKGARRDDDLPPAA